MNLPTFTGTPLAVGQAVGETYRDDIRGAYSRTLEGLPSGFSHEHLQKILLSGWYLTRREFPAVAAELAGMAEGSGLRPLALFLSWYGELLDIEEMRGCTDIAATGTATRNGKALLGHNNDMDNRTATEVFRLAVDGQPTVLSFSCDGAPNAGTNSAGLAFGGNTLTNIDIRWGGIPRLVLFRAALAAQSIEEALRISLHPLRTSSYNNIFANDQGQIINEEGSATSAAGVWLRDGVLSHSNHYALPEMHSYEGKKVPELMGSRVRKHRSKQLLEQVGQHTPETFRHILSDHVGWPNDSICLHHDGKTVFSIITEPEDRVVWYCEGNPCEGRYTPIRY